MKIASTLFLSVVLLSLIAGTGIAAKKGLACNTECGDSYNSGCVNNEIYREFPFWVCGESKVDENCKENKTCTIAIHRYFKAGTQTPCTEKIKEFTVTSGCCDGYIYTP